MPIQHISVAWWRIGRFNTFRPKGRGLESCSSHHVGTLGKSFTRCSASAWNSGTVSMMYRELFWVVEDLKRRYRNSLNKHKLHDICYNYALINSFIHTEHLYSASSRKLLRGAPNFSTAKKSSLKVRTKAGEKCHYSRTSVFVRYWWKTFKFGKVTIMPSVCSSNFTLQEKLWNKTYGKLYWASRYIHM